MTTPLNINLNPRSLSETRQILQSLAQRFGAHTHTSADITDFTEAAQDATGAMAANSTRVTLIYVDGTPSLTADLVANTITAGYLSFTATDKIAGRSSSGAGAGEEITCTSFARSILDDANAAAVQSTLSLVPGTHVQAYDAELAALAGLTSAANKVPMFSGSGTASLLDFLDEDNFASNSATGVPSQQSVKAYVDAAAAAAAVADGDKGDVTVSSSGSVWTIDIVTAYTRTLLDDANATTALSTLGLSANGKSLVTAADYAAMRALLDLEAGTDFYSITAADAAFQPKDADLTTWASLTPSANAQSLVTAANYAAMRALLDLEAGTDFYSIAAANAAFQPLDAELTALSGLTSAANKIPRYTGSGTADVIDFLDEDDFASDSSSAVPTQQSVKAYVDAEVSGTSGGGTLWQRLFGL